MLAAVPLLGQTSGDIAPIFDLESLEGHRASLSDYGGHPVLLNVWATWCEPCRDEIPLIISAHREHQPNGLVVLAINLTDQEASTKHVRKFVTEFGMPFPVLLDKKGKARKLYALRGVPTSVFVGTDGVIRAVNPGPIDQAALRERLSEILPSP
jgi:thiol-disulfide isomerase/thioredoxin